MTKPPAPPDICPRCGKHICLVEYRHTREDYAGTSEYACVDGKNCGYRLGRWTMEEIAPGYIESKRGTRGHVLAVSKDKR